MTSVLFVDDEPRILNGLRKMLQSMRDEWHMEFAESGAEALERLAAHRFDVLVTDVRMPQMSGGDLLARVQESHPEVARIALCGSAAIARSSAAWMSSLSPCRRLARTIPRSAGR